MWKQVRAFLIRVAGPLHKARRDRELAEEIESHLQLQTEDNLRAGMTPESARRSALVRFGGVEGMKEEYRDRSALPLLETVAQDLRYGLRTLRKNPGFTAVAGLTLGLGIGGCGAMYAYIQQLVLSDNPYPDPGSLVVVQEVDPLDAGSNRGVSGHAFLDVKKDSQTFADIGGYETDGFVLMSNDRLPILDGAVVTPNTFEILGVKPLRGRVFREDEARPGQDQVVLISERAWKRYFGARNDLIGSSIDLGRKLYTVVGIMPQGFWRERDVWIPLPLNPAGAGRMRTWARLRSPGAHGPAQAELDVLSARLARDHPETQGTWKLTVLDPFAMSAGERGIVGAVLVAPVALVLLIACVNVAHLQLGRSSQRTREMAVRLAIGASRRRLTRQLLTESLLLAAIGGTLGIVFASWGTKAISAYLPPGSVELIGRLTLDGGALLFLMLLSAASTVLFGLFPALRVSALSPSTALKEGSRHTAPTSFRNWLVVSELAFTTMLLVGTGMMVLLVRQMTHTDMGFDERNLWTARLSVRGPMRTDPAARRNWAASTLEQVRAVAGVTSAAIANELPLLGGDKRRYEPVGETVAGERLQAEYRAVSPGYLETLRLPLRQGRALQDHDHEGSVPVVLVNEAMARRLFPQGALGQRLRVLSDDIAAGAQPMGDVREVVGVVADERQTPIDALPAPPIAYVPFRQDPIAPLSLVVRTQGPPDAVARAILDRINAPSAELIVQSVFVFERAIQDRIRARSFLPISMAVFAAFGLVLSAVGLYGTASRAVGQRRQEFGIRQALGARAADVVTLVLGQTARGSAIGLAIGATASLAAATLLLKVLDPRERSAFGAELLSASEVLLVALAAAMVLLAVTLIATYLPARRASSVDPVAALRYE
jgi:putative ABC transport system permease protein